MVTYRRKPKPTLIVENARAVCATLEELFAQLDVLRVSAEACNDYNLISEVRRVKQALAETRALPWLRELQQ